MKWAGKELSCDIPMDCGCAHSVKVKSHFCIAVTRIKLEVKVLIITWYSFLFLSCFSSYCPAKVALSPFYFYN